MITTRVLDADSTNPSDDDVAALITSAFHSLAAAAWIVNSSIERGPVLHTTFREGIRQARSVGEVHVALDSATTGALLGAAVWLHHGGIADKTSTDPDPDYVRRLGPYAARVELFDMTLAAHHPDEPNYDHLALLAVHPDHQGRGIGSMLLNQHHNTLDILGRSAFLHASSPVAASLYKRHGYEEGNKFQLPGDGPPLWPMRRRPR